MLRVWLFQLVGLKLDMWLSISWTSHPHHMLTYWFQSRLHLTGYVQLHITWENSRIPHHRVSEDELECHESNIWCIISIPNAEIMTGIVRERSLDPVLHPSKSHDARQPVIGSMIWPSCSKSRSPHCVPQFPRLQVLITTVWLLSAKNNRHRN